MSFNINSIASQAFNNFQIQGSFAFAGVGQASPFQAAEQMLAGLIQQNPMMRSMQPTAVPGSYLPSPMGQLPTGRGGMNPMSLGQFQPIFQQLQGALAMLGKMAQFAGMRPQIGQMGQNFAQMGKTGMFNSDMTTPMPGSIGAQGLPGQFNRVGNLMGFAAGGFMASTRIGFSPSRLVTETKDKYAGLKSGMGHISDKTNLAQLPEAKIALNEIMKSKGSKKMDKVAETLKKDYGLEAEVKTIKDGKGKSRKAIEIRTADGRKGMIVDGNGNNSLDKSEYKFKEAASEVMQKYGLTGLDPKNAVQAIKQMSQPQMTMQTQFAGMGMMGGMMGNGMMGGANMGMNPAGGISGRAGNYMQIFGGMMNANNHNVYGTFQQNNFLGGWGQQPSAATPGFFNATSQFALLAAEAYKLM